jgi:hypothetical protein
MLDYGFRIYELRFWNYDFGFRNVETHSLPRPPSGGRASNSEFRMTIEYRISNIVSWTGRGYEFTNSSSSSRSRAVGSPITLK